MMDISQNGIQEIIRHEGIAEYDSSSNRYYLYYDSANKPTIGIGHLITTPELKSGRIDTGIDKVNYKNGLTLVQCHDLFRKDIQRFEDAINNLVKVPISQNQYDALVSFTFNIGIGAFKKSTLLRKLNAKDYEGAANEFPRWNKAGGKIIRGLVIRRSRERALFLS